MEVLQEQYKDTKIGRIPKNWEVKKLKEITKYQSSQISLNSLVENNGEYKLYGASGFLKNIDFYQSEEPYFAIVKDGSGFGNLIWCDSYSSILGTLGSIKNLECSSLKFCYYLMNTIKFKRYMSGSTIPHLYFKDYGNINLAVPPLPEQQKIADILSTVDVQISTTQAIIDKSKELKKGLMQKLFTEGIGHTEFKDTKIGRIPKDWEVVKLGNTTLKIKDGTHGTHKDFEDGMPLLSAKDIRDGKIDVPADCRKISFKDYEAIHRNFQLKDDDILLTVVGTIGRVAILKNYNSNFTFQRSVAYIRLKGETVSDFYAQYFISREFTKQLLIRANASAQAGVYLGELSKIPIPIPPIYEQRKIAEILSEADAKIEKEENEKAQLEQLKKGLMQQLLTGKKRVKV